MKNKTTKKAQKNQNRIKVQKKHTKAQEAGRGGWVEMERLIATTHSKRVKIDFDRGHITAPTTIEDDSLQIHKHPRSRARTQQITSAFIWRNVWDDRNWIFIIWLYFMATIDGGSPKLNSLTNFKYTKAKKQSQCCGACKKPTSGRSWASARGREREKTTSLKVNKQNK